MRFPLEIPLGPYLLNAHFVFESLAYFVAFRIYLWQRRAGDFLNASSRLSLIAAAAVGAAIGSKVLAWFEDPAALFAHWNAPAYLMGGKTIVGGLLGGTIAVECIKRR